jgi:hypothetical protein
LDAFEAMPKASLSRSLARFPFLEKIHLEDALLMVIDIMDILMQANSLRVLILNNVVLQGVLEKFDA